MYSGKTVFAQLMDCLPWSTFSRLVARYGGDHDVRTFPCVEQYRALIGIGGHLTAPPLPHHRAYGSRTTAVRPG